MSFNDGKFVIFKLAAFYTFFHFKEESITIGGLTGFGIHLDYFRSQ